MTRKCAFCEAEITSAFFWRKFDHDFCNGDHLEAWTEDEIQSLQQQLSASEAARGESDKLLDRVYDDICSNAYLKVKQSTAKILLKREVAKHSGGGEPNTKESE